MIIYFFSFLTLNKLFSEAIFLGKLRFKFRLKFRAKFWAQALIWGLLFFSFFSCASTPKKNQNTVLSRDEFKFIAKKFSDKIVAYVSEVKSLNPDQDFFLSLLPTKNDSLNNLPLSVLENGLVNNLLNNRIYTIRREDRKDALSEAELQLAGFTDGDNIIGRMKSPNYFIKISIEENYLPDGNDRIVEQTIQMEMRNVATQVVEVSDRVEFVKKQKTSRSVVW